MEKQVKLKNNEYFSLEDELKIYDDLQFVVMTGARGCGKTFSTSKLLKKYFSVGKSCLYLRNTRDDLATARQYFNFLIDDHEIQRINLGSLGANTIVFEEKDESGRWSYQELVGYTLAISDFERLKSAKRQIDYIVYEEFSSLSTRKVNRVFSLTEIIETVRQTCPKFLFFAISNNLYKDTLFNVLLDDNAFIHFEITKKTPNLTVKNVIVKNYLQGDYLIPDISISLKNYHCVGFVQVAGQNIYIFYSASDYPEYVLSSKGAGVQLKLDSEIIRIMSTAYYKNLNERNEIEFLVGLIVFAKKKLLV